MPAKINLAALMVAAMVLSFGGSGLAAPPAGAIRVEQAPTTSYMRSQVGTPDELSPLAPAHATNVRKVGDQWLCEVNGQTMGFDAGTSCWEPRQPEGRKK
jgi:hypothetical protein